MVTAVADATAAVVAWNVALAWPCVTITLAGTVAALGLLLLTATSAPPAGAAALSATVPVEAVPAVTVLGFRLTLESVAAGAVPVVPPLLLPGEALLPLGEPVLLPEKVPAVCDGVPPQPIRNRNVRKMTRKKMKRGTLG
jgi:hypothetical protein